VSAAEVSVVMPVWRPRPEWLREAVDSVLGQRDVDLELVVVDDGNDVPVADVLAPFGGDRRLQVVRVAHGGVSAARNAGLKAAVGEYLRFLDADDVCEPGSTARLRTLADPGTIAYEDTLVRDEGTGRSYRISSRLRGSIAVPCLLGEFDSRHVSMLFPRDVVRRAGGWDPRLRVREDFDFVLRCLEHAPVVPGEGVATTYRRHDASATRSARAVEDAESASRMVLTGFFARHPELRGTPTEREAWRRLHDAEARTALDQDRPLRTLVRAAPLLRLAPRDAAAWSYRAARSAARLSGAATARTTARARGALRRSAG
jgi:glycosyltransferase involved in cell wall biosynthesis